MAVAVDDDVHRLSCGSVAQWSGSSPHGRAVRTLVSFLCRPLAGRDGDCIASRDAHGDAESV